MWEQRNFKKEVQGNKMRAWGGFLHLIPQGLKR